ncbi:MAG: alpha-galactosidase [Kiritimatiellae bacterium]|jgi:alpha-galactosidase|nr:alpha-galactosidase [Kiritimatiellia bacterium]
MNKKQINLPFGTVEISGDCSSFFCKLTSVEEDGVFYITLSLEAEIPSVPPSIGLIWRTAAVDTLCQWRPNKGVSHKISPSWGDAGLHSQVTSQAPVICLYDVDGSNRLTFALDDALHPTCMKAGVIEETAEFECKVFPFEGFRQADKSFKVELRVDTNSHPFYQALSDVRQWWESLDGYEPMEVCDSGRLPMYSTWYSFHQELSSNSIEKQCQLAKEIGCDTVIVDDGWQTLDAQRGYAFTGDWKPERLTDIGESVKRIHAIGMKYMLWYSVPFVGETSEAYKRFKNMLLKSWNPKFAVVDPRYPEVREYLISTYVDALDQWDLDGFKLDFVDSFTVNPEDDILSTAPGRDFDCVYEAADRLMADVADKLKALKPEIMLEFRQSYIGPKMRRYGNLFRAGDCPLDVLSNRVSTIDIRLLAGTTAAHADMIMWHKDDSAENAARQILNVLFSVPQISVLLDAISASQKQMLTHYLKFWRENRDVLLDGELKPQHPESMYPTIIASSEIKEVVVLYASQLAQLPSEQKTYTHVVNATGSTEIVLSGIENYKGHICIYDCCGNRRKIETFSGNASIICTVPISGRLEVVKP